MAMDLRWNRYRPNLLSIVPPYPVNSPPAGPAALLAYLKANGCNDFGFLDLRLHTPHRSQPTYRPSGAFGESFVLDVPDLPIVLHVLRAADAQKPLTEGLDDWFSDYCLMRGISPPGLSSYLRYMDRFLERAFAAIPDVRFIGFSTWTSNFLTTLMAAAHLKKRKQPPFIVAGGPQVTESKNSARLALQAGLFDAVALGEGEETLLSLYEAFCKNGKGVGVGIPGTMQLDPSRGFVTAEQPLLRLRDLPTPDFDEMMVGSYQDEIGTMDAKARVLPFQLSRGCTDKCSFCSEWVFWRKFRMGSMDLAVEQLEELIKRYGADLIHFTDSLLNGTLPRLKEFAEKLLRKGVTVKWRGFLRANIDRETAALVRRAGLVSTFVGIESLSDETLELMNKRRTEADNIAALRNLLEAGVRVMAGYIPGFPGDTRGRFLHTARVLLELQNQFPGLLTTNTEPFILSPGQPIFHELDKYGLTLSRWPEATFARAGRYEAIARDVAFTFDGPNQGIDRLGELCVAETLFGSTSARADEELTPLDIAFTHVQLDTFIARTQAPAGHTHALLVTRSEKEAYERRRGLEGLEYNPEGEVPLLERRGYADWWSSIEKAHVIQPSSRDPGLFPSVYQKNPTKKALLRASPFLVARVYADELVLIHSITLARLSFPASAREWFNYLAKEPHTREALETEAARFGLAVEIERLIEDDFVLACSDEGQRRPFIARTKPVLAADSKAPSRRLPTV
jgi:radical SAM superfamily enzyme YgiQ (UPF0313 family)